MGDVIQFRQRPYIPVIASCSNCCGTWRVMLRIDEYNSWFKGKKKICKDCGMIEVDFCRTEDK